MILADLALIAWILSSGGGQLRISDGLSISATSLKNPLTALVVAAPVWCWVRRGSEGPLARAMRSAWANFRFAPWPHKLAMLLSLWVAIVQVESVLALEDDLRPPGRSDPRAAKKILANGANLHASGVVEFLAGRRYPGPAVLYVDDFDTRGHSAAFYAYPRLILSEPSERRWGLRERMLRVVESEGPRETRPPASRSRDFAAARDAILISASPMEVRLEPLPQKQGR